MPGSSGNSSAAWHEFARSRNIPDPDPEPLSVSGHTVPLIWRDHYVAAVFDSPDEGLKTSLTNKGFELVELGSDSAAWNQSVDALARLLGKSA